MKIRIWKKRMNFLTPLWRCFGYLLYLTDTLKQCNLHGTFWLLRPTVMFLFPKRNDRDVNNIANYTFKAQSFLFVNQRFCTTVCMKRGVRAILNLWTLTDLADNFLPMKIKKSTLKSGILLMKFKNPFWKLSHLTISLWWVSSTPFGIPFHTPVQV